MANEQFKIRNLQDIFVAEKPKEIILKYPSVNNGAWEESRSQFVRTTNMCNNLGIKFQILLPGCTEPKSLSYLNNGFDYLNKRTIEDIGGRKLDMGVLFHSCLCCDRDYVKESLEELFKTVPKEKVFILSPAERFQLSANLGEYSANYEKKWNLPHRIITLN